MIFVYLRKGNIIKKSEMRLQTIECDSIVEVPYNIQEKIILEDGKIVKYNQSNQYKKDHQNDIKPITKKERIIPTRPKPQISDFVKKSRQIALLHQNKENDKTSSDDMIGAKSGGPTRWDLKPSKSGLGS